MKKSRGFPANKTTSAVLKPFAATDFLLYNKVALGTDLFLQIIFLN